MALQSNKPTTTQNILMKYVQHVPAGMIHPTFTTLTQFSLRKKNLRLEDASITQELRT